MSAAPPQPDGHAYVEARCAEFDQISAARRQALDALADAIVDSLDASGEAHLVFICTHNSRRSQMSELWAQVAADRAGIAGVRTYSGGTESTAFNPRAVAALQRAGLDIQRATEDPNPHYLVSGAGLRETHRCWSKTFTDSNNPQSEFIAVMTCSDADQACPFVPGAAVRVPVTYVDPKVSDGTDAESATYDERCAQIACELLYVFDGVRASRG